MRDWLLSTFRPAKRAPVRRHLWMTLAQTAVFWFVFLVLGPIALLALESLLGVPGFVFAGGSAVAWILFGIASGAGLWSGVTMAVRGQGTPLPMECPRALVIQGPYRYVRNPMAVAGLSQGASIGLAQGSWLILGYVLAGAILWNTWVRPVEEEDLRNRFGESFAKYASEVRCWVPRWSAYRP